MKRIHIVGISPRSGTTLLAECMIAGFEIDAFDAHETPLTTHRRDVNIYLTKKPVDIHIVGPRLSVDRNFHVVAMVRDPRDIVVSVHRQDPSRYWAPLRYWKSRLAVLRRLSRHKRCVVIRYEDLVREPDSVQEGLAARMPFLTPRRSFSAFHKSAAPSRKSLDALGPLRAINSQSIGNWRNHLRRLKGQLSQHGSITEDLIEFGYERDDSWLSVLESVEPDLSPSHWPEHFALPVWTFRRLKYAEAARVAALRLFRIDEG
jgi:hypothetical protein